MTTTRPTLAPSIDAKLTAIFNDAENEANTNDVVDMTSPPSSPSSRAGPALTGPSLSSSSRGPALAAIIKDAENDPNTNESTMELIDWMTRCTIGYPRRRNHIRSTPLFELSTICINPRTLTSRQFIQLYGHVKFIDDNEAEFQLFHRPVDDALLVGLSSSSSSSSVILLRGSDHTRPLWLPKFCRLDVCLRDKLTDMVIAEDVIRLDFTSSEVVYDKEQECYLGPTSAKLTYIVHSYAVIASVDCTLLKNNHHDLIKKKRGRRKKDDDDDTNVGSDEFGYTTIAATYMGRNKQPISRILLSGDDKLLLDASRTFWLAVPAYSPTLKLDVNLSGFDGTTCGSDYSLEFEVRDGSIAGCREDIVVGKWLIEFLVFWRHAFSDLEKASLEESDKEFSESEQEIDRRAFDKKIVPDRAVLGKRKTLLTSIELPPLDRRISSIYSSHPLHLVEVFSIAIFSYDDDGNPITLSDHSRIKVEDTLGPHDMLCVVRPMLRPWNILHVDDPCRRCFLGHNYFEMELDLKDVQDREISKGFLIWDYHSVNNWHDRRICSVVAGNDGFAAVHYTIFEDAVQARVKVVFIGDDDCGCAVWGRICCRYTGYRYFTSYEKRYYQSVLFEMDESEDHHYHSLLLRDGDEVPFCKSVVCVPVDASLMVEVELCILVDGYVEKLRGTLLYKAEGGAKKTKIRSQPQSIKGSKYGVSVFVEWGTGSDDDFCLKDPLPN